MCRPVLALALLLATLAGLLPAPARAQVSPAVQKLIQHLNPLDNRGIRRLGAPAVSLTVNFANGSTQLGVQARRTLDQLGAALSSPTLARYRFRIEGHTDTVGSADYNLALSQRRADAVAAYLEAHFSVAARRLVAVGMGERGLLVPTPPQTANAKNRRVQVVNIGR